MMMHFLKNLHQYLIPKHALTRLAGFAAANTNPKLKNFLITRFINTYKVDMSEALQKNPFEYASFNDFFIRHLKKDIRPIAKADIVSPVDGSICELGRIEKGHILQAKKHFFTVEELLGTDKKTSDLFLHGSFISFYLSPKDYHRIHMPMEGSLQEMIYIPGKLFSVKPSSVNAIPKLFARNERLVVFFKTPLGLMAMVLVGATIVGTIGTSWEGDLPRSHKSYKKQYDDENKQSLKKGEEMGYFKLGSSVILLFTGEYPIHWKEGLKGGNSIRFGESLV